MENVDNTAEEQTDVAAEEAPKSKIDADVLQILR